ncbi:MAG: peptidoglycan-binding protein [Archangium sp.]
MKINSPRPSLPPTNTQRPTQSLPPRPPPQASDDFEPSRSGPVSLAAPRGAGVNSVEDITTDRTTFLRRGASGSAVEDLQRKLKEAGFDPGEIDGKMGPKTEAAVRAYQQAKGLQVDGIVGPETRASLLGQPYTRPTPSQPGGASPQTPPTDGNGTTPQTPGTDGTAPAQSGNTATARELEAMARSKHGQAFVDQVNAMAGRLGVRPEWIFAVMKNESGMDPAAVNRTSNATGLIQFMPETARGLGTSVEALRNMSATEQLRYVERYFQPYAGKIRSGPDMYMATFWPAGLGKPDSYNIGGATVARQNPIFDLNRNGQITAGEFREYYRRRYPELA